MIDSVPKLQSGPGSAEAEATLAALMVRNPGARCFVPKKQQRHKMRRLVQQR